VLHVSVEQTRSGRGSALHNDQLEAKARATESGFAGKNINPGMRTSPCKVTDPQKLESAATECKSLHCTAMGCESGRQDSNLRPLVPQTSRHFPISAEFDLECFRREMVGMTTRARAMESAGIAERFLNALRLRSSLIAGRITP
jgi:hypothetical protein